MKPDESSLIREKLTVAADGHGHSGESLISAIKAKIDKELAESDSSLMYVPVEGLEVKHDAVYNKHDSEHSSSHKDKHSSHKNEALLRHHESGERKM